MKHPVMADALLDPNTAKGQAAIDLVGVPLMEGALGSADYARGAKAAFAQLKTYFTSYTYGREAALDLSAARIAFRGLTLDVPETQASVSVYIGGHDGVTSRVVLARTARDSARTIAERGHVHIDPHMDVREYDEEPSNGSPVRVLIEAGMQPQNIVLLGPAPFRNYGPFADWAIDSGTRIVPGYSAVSALPNELSRLHEMGLSAVSVTCDIDAVRAADVPAAPGARPIGIEPLLLAEAAFTSGLHPLVDIINVTEVAIDRSVDPKDRTAQFAAEVALYAMAGAAKRIAGGLARDCVVDEASRASCTELGFGRNHAS